MRRFLSLSLDLERDRESAGDFESCPRCLLRSGLLLRLGSGDLDRDLERRESRVRRSSVCLREPTASSSYFFDGRGDCEREEGCLSLGMLTVLRKR